MEKFEVNILGCGSAVPNARHMTTAQLVNVHEKVFLVDCGEGTQTQIWKSGLKVTNMNHIFISHAHGDHFFGLVPLISSLGLILDRTADLHLWLPGNLRENLERDFKAYCNLPFKFIMHELDTEKRTVIYEDKELTVETIPLSHRIPCCGFLFCEKPKLPVLLPEKCNAYGIPPKEFGKIKAGADWTLEDGTVIPNSEFTEPSDFVPRKYAYCSDTAYFPEIIPQIEGALYPLHCPMGQPVGMGGQGEMGDAAPRRRVPQAHGHHTPQGPLPRRLPHRRPGQARHQRVRG